MILLDTSFLIALTRKADVHYPRAKEMFEAMVERKAITDHIFHEFVSYLIRKDGAEQAYMAGRELLESDTERLAILSEDLMPALELVKKYGKLSFCDASSVIVMKKLGMKRIASFDSDFDLVQGIERVC